MAFNDNNEDNNHFSQPTAPKSRARGVVGGRVFAAVFLLLLSS
jgi:hypothetical protein